MRWIPAIALGALGLVAAVTWRHGGPHGCTYFMMSDIDSVQQVGRSWFPPRVDCRFAFQGESWLERQPAWESLLPVSFSVSSGVCAWYAARHPAVDAGPQRRAWWRHVAGVVAYWLIALATAAGMIAMLWRDPGMIGVLPLVTIPLLSLWTLQWLWRAAAWSSMTTWPATVSTQPVGS